MKFKKILCFTLATTIAFTATLSSSASIFADETVLSGEKETYVVLTETAKNGKEIISDYDGEALYSNEAVSCELTERQADKLEDQPGVLAVSEDIILTGTGKQIKDKKRIKNETPEQWNLDAIGVNESDANSSDVKIEVLDSGVSYTDDINIQSSVNLVPGEEEVSPMFVDANGHGTGIAGLIGAKDNNDGIKGVYPNAEIYSVKALDENLKSPLSRIVEGIYWGIENDMDIINMSFGTSVNTDVLHEAVKAAADAGIILIAAAGNTEHQNVNYPAAYNEVIAVGSINAEGELAELTSTGTQLELLAPGEQVYTTGLFYGTIGVSGTSIATAQVTGTAALLKAKDKTKSADFIRGLLKASSKEVAGTGARLIDYNYALDIYDEYAKNYIEGENIDNGFENTEEIPDYSDDADVIVEGLWASTAHRETIENAAYAEGSLSDSDISLIASISNLADKQYAASKGYTCLHSNWNYVLSLKYLYAFSKKIKNSTATTISAQVAEAEKAARTTALSGANNNSSKELTYFNNLVSATSSMVKSKGSGYAKKPKQRRNLVLGFIFHLLGDLYAHNTVVPTYTISGKTYKESKSVSSKDANFGKSHFTSSGWTNLKKAINAQTASFTSVTGYESSNKTAAQLRSLYEDNTKFCKERFADAKDACEFFWVNYSTGFSLAIIMPVYGLKLHQFYIWASRAGYGNYFSISEWKRYSNYV